MGIMSVKREWRMEGMRRSLVGCILMLVNACGGERLLPGASNSNAGLNEATPVAIRGFEALSTVGRVRLTIFQGEPPSSEETVVVGTIQEVIRHSSPKESPSGLPVIEEYLETLPGRVPVYYSGGGDPLLFSAYVGPDQAARTRNPVLSSVPKEFSRVVSYCSSFRFKGPHLLRSVPKCQPMYYCQDLVPVDLACSITGEGEGQCETGIFWGYLAGVPRLSRSFYQWILTEDPAFECQARGLGRTTPVVLAESERVERLEWRVEPGVRLRVRVPNPLPAGEPWILRELQFPEGSFAFSWDK